MKSYFTLNPPPQKAEHVPTESQDWISFIGVHHSDAFAFLNIPTPARPSLQHDRALK